MKVWDFDPLKSGEEFRHNYKLHDLAESQGKRMLKDWGFTFNDFGMDKRNEKVWEKGEDKPDLIMSYNGRRALLDWKGKHKSVWLINKRAFISYRTWMKKFGVPVFVCFFVFDNLNAIQDIRFACIGRHSFLESKGKEWDKNATVEFEMDLPEFTKENMLSFIYKSN